MFLVTVITGDGLRLSELTFSLALAANARRMDGNLTHSCMERLTQADASKIIP